MPPLPVPSSANPNPGTEEADTDAIEMRDHFIELTQMFLEAFQGRERARKNWMARYKRTQTRARNPERLKPKPQSGSSQIKDRLKLEWLKEQQQHRSSLQSLYLRRREHSPSSVETNELVIDDLYVIYKDGRLLLHHSGASTQSIDEDVITSMFAALQDFVKDSLKEYDDQELNILQYGDVAVLFEHGRHVFMAVVGRGPDSDEFRISLRKLVKDFEAMFHPVLEKWDGSMAPFKSFRDQLATFSQRFVKHGNAS